jgi:hypothetical protein
MRVNLTLYQPTAKKLAYSAYASSTCRRCKVSCLLIAGRMTDHQGAFEVISSVCGASLASKGRAADLPAASQVRHGRVTGPYAGITMPHAAVTAPHRNFTAPHGGMTAPHGGMTAPHGGMTAPHGGMTAPHGGMTAPCGRMTSTHRIFSAPHRIIGGRCGGKVSQCVHFDVFAMHQTAGAIEINLPILRVCARSTGTRRTKTASLTGGTKSMSLGQASWNRVTPVTSIQTLLP